MKKFARWLLVLISVCCAFAFSACKPTTNNNSNYGDIPEAGVPFDSTWGNPDA